MGALQLAGGGAGGEAAEQDADVRVVSRSSSTSWSRSGRAEPEGTPTMRTSGALLSIEARSCSGERSTSRTVW